MKKYLYRSIGLHIAVLLILIVDLPMFGRHKMTMGQAPIIVDLKDVKLSEMTNLPPKAVLGKEEKKAVQPEKSAPKWTSSKTPETPVSAPKVEKAEKVKGDFLETKPVQDSKKEKPKPQSKPTPKPVPKPAPKPVKKPVHPEPEKKPRPQPKPAPKQQPKQNNKKTPQKPEEVKTIANPLKSLMESVNSLEKEIGKEAASAVIKEGTEVLNMGVEGGTGGSYFSELSITETDAIAGYLRECWNFDPGGRNVEQMIVEIRAYLNKDGSIRDVRIVDTSRYNSDPHFRAVAESAKRAVWACSNKNNRNIYKIFPEKYADKYNLWNTLLLKFNPMDASVQ